MKYVLTGESNLIYYSQFSLITENMIRMKSNTIILRPLPKR